MSKLPLKVQNITKKFDDFAAVSDISFELNPGEILGLLGPNGAGKTTTIQMLLGLLTPTSGQIQYWGDKLANNRQQIMERVSFSSTYTRLPYDLKAKEILHYTSYLFQIPERDQKVAEVIDLFRLQDILKIPTKEMSSGQKTRLNLAKAFLNDPEILLLDEPTASLDPDIADYIRRIILEQRKNRNISVIFTSHNMAEVEMVCDRVIFLRKGKIVANDTPKSLANTIKTVYLELFIGKELEKVLGVLLDEKFEARIDGGKLIVRLDESEIPNVLIFLKSKDIEVIEININKPTLEDYFLKLAKEENLEYQ